MKKQRIDKLTQGGVVLGWEKQMRGLYLNCEDTHTLVIGATRCGKTRTVVLPSIIAMALAGESIIAIDPKGELYGYCAPMLKRLDYEVIATDFKDPERSIRYNFLQPVLDAALLQNIPLAVSRARDIAQLLVPDSDRHTDPIWLDGERSVLTTGMLAVALECHDPMCQNMANVREFLAKMCAPVGEKDRLPLVAYLADLPEDSPLKLAMAIARIAPQKMRGSFYTSALATLDLFQDPQIHAMSALTDYDYVTTGERKRAVFLILPDERSAYYPLAALYVYEQYQALVQYADSRGGRLPRRVNFVCDEFGNFCKIPDFDKFITVGGGRGIRFHLFLQNLGQLSAKYGDELAITISSNCETWIYLYTSDSGDGKSTLQALCKKLDRYTIKSPSLSGSSGGQQSAGYNYTGRDLLTVDEISKNNRPYQLVLSRYGKIVMYAPDLSETPFNRMLGMGDKDHNTNLLLYRLTGRPKRPCRVYYWGIWLPYINRLENQD